MENKCTCAVDNWKEVNETLPDIQNLNSPHIDKEIPRVGIKGFKLPITVMMKEKGKQLNTIAKLSSYSNLSSKLKGTNMSRYSIVLTDSFLDKQVSILNMPDILDNLAEKIGSTNSYIQINFDYLITKKAPNSKTPSFFNVPCIIEGQRVFTSDGEKEGLNYEFYLTTFVNYTSLCPCSKEISKYGAHNQRSTAIIKVELKNPREKDYKLFYIEDAVDVVEKHASAPIRNTLKRVDEKHQTELMYERPRFVEDMSRLIAIELEDNYLDKTIYDFSVVIEHYESIHQLDAVAMINAGRKLI